MTVPPQSLLPLGTEIRLNPTTRSYSGGTALLGGSPTRLVRLRNAPASLLSSGQLAITSTATAALADRLIDIGIADIDLKSMPSVPLDQVTVVVPVYGTPEPLARLLRALEGVRTIVVDDASPNAEQIASVAQTHSATLLRLAINSGPATARNHGLRHVETPFVAFCDADTVVTTRALKNLLRHFHDQRVAIAAPRIVALKNDTTPNWISRYEAVRSSLDLGATSGVVRPHSRVAWIPSACLIARVSALGTGFEESMRMGEDVDLVWRLAAQGWLIRYDATIAVEHEHRRSTHSWLGRKYHYGTSAAHLAARHGNAVAPAVLSPAFAVMNGALLMQRRWGPGVALAALTCQAVRLRRQLGPIDTDPALTLALCARGAGDSVQQTSRLMLRTWWPITALAALASPRARRALALAALTDTSIDWVRRRPQLDVARFALARRLDDAADGIGAWTGAWRSGSIRCLMPSVQSAPSLARTRTPMQNETAVAAHE